MADEASSPVLSAAADLYGTSAADFVKLGAFESDVYAFEGSSGPSILKVIAPEHRTHDQVQAEIDWLLALTETGVRVAEPLRARTGKWIESFGDRDAAQNLLVAFRRSPGRVTGPADWTDDRIEGWGELLGRLQRHSRSWTPPGPRRGDLSQQTYLRRVAESVPDDPRFIEGASELLEQVTPLLDQGSDSGLIHADLHHGNLLLDGELWTAIDFDDAAYGPYAFDLAMSLYYAVRSRREQSPDEAAEEFLGPFLRGFRRQARDPVAVPETISLFLRYRDAELVLALRTKLDDEDWTDALRQTEANLRRNVGERREVVSLTTLRRWF